MPPIRRSNTLQPRLLAATPSSDTTLDSLTSSQHTTSIITKRNRGRPMISANSSTPTTSRTTPSIKISPPSKASPNTTYSHHLRKCLGCKLFLPSYLLIALFPKSLHDYKEKCIKCRRSMDAVGDYVKTHGNQNGDLTLHKQLDHLKAQREVLEKWRSSLAKMSVVVEDEWIDEAIETIQQHPALAEAKEWLEEQSDFDERTNGTPTTAPNTPPKPLVLIQSNHISLLSPEPTPRRIVQLRLPQCPPLKAPYFLSAGNTQLRPQTRSIQSAPNLNVRHDSAISNTDHWATGVKDTGRVCQNPNNMQKESWMSGLEEAEIMAVQGLVRMRCDMRGVGLRQQRFTTRVR